MNDQTSPIIILLYIVTVFIIINILNIVTYKIKYPFWSKLSGFHTYQWWYWIHGQTIVNSIKLSNKNKYYNNDYVTEHFNTRCTDDILNNFIAFINKEYMNYNDAVYSISKIQLESVFSPTSFVTLCYDDGEKSSLKGTLLSIPFLMWCKNFKINNNMKMKYDTGDNDLLQINYVDYLCVSKHHRRSNVASSIIYTHLTNVEHHVDNLKSKNIYASNYDKIQDIYLFKNEGFSTKALVPVVDYNGYVIDLDNVTLNECGANIEVLNTYKCRCVHLDPNNTSLLNTAIDSIYSTNNYGEYSFEFVSLFTKEIFINHVKSVDIVVYCLIEKDALIGLYLFKDIHSLIDNKTYEFVSCCSLNLKNKSDRHYKPFIYGFKISCVLCSDYLTTLRCSNTKYSYGLCCVEEISHNYNIITKVGLNNKNKYVIPFRYYTYNGIIHTKHPSKILIIS